MWLLFSISLSFLHHFLVDSVLQINSLLELRMSGGREKFWEFFHQVLLPPFQILLEPLLTFQIVVSFFVICEGLYVIEWLACVDIHQVNFQEVYIVLHLLSVFWCHHSFHWNDISKIRAILYFQLASPRSWPFSFVSTSIIKNWFLNRLSSLCLLNPCIDQIIDCRRLICIFPIVLFLTWCFGTFRIFILFNMSIQISWCLEPREQRLLISSL
jgi:hypothetical protein